MNKLIYIEGEKYALDMKKAMDAGHLKRYKEIEFVVGGIYEDVSHEHSPVRIVQAVWCSHAEESDLRDKEVYALLGMNNFANPYSNSFFESLHTKDEILEYLRTNDLYLTEKKMVVK